MRKLIKTNEVSQEAKNALKQRTLIALIMLIVLIPCLIIGGWAYLGLVIIAIGASTYEIAKAPSRKLSWLVWAITFIVMYSLVFWLVFKSNIKTNWEHFDVNTCFTEINLSPIALAVMIALYLFVVIIKSKEFRLVDACYLIAMTLLLSLGFQAILAVRYLPFKHFGALDGFDVTKPTFKYAQSIFLIIYLLIAIFFNDIGAYLVGIFFGKHKMAPHVSPKKTWEGFAGGVSFSFLSSIAFGLSVAHCGLPILPIFSKTNGGWCWIILVSAILPLVAVLGDLSFSAIKRQFGKKDYSKVLGPHGGVLDRIDSTLFGALALVILVIFISNGWSFFQ